MSEQISILLVDDDDIDRHAVVRYVRNEKLPYRLFTAASEQEALDLLKKQKYDVLLLDYDLKTSTGLDLLPYIGDTPAIIITGGGNEKIAVEAMRLGANDYLVKDPDRNYLAVLPITIRNVIDHKKAERELKKREERFRALTEKMNDIVIIIDKEDHISYSSPSSKTFGYEPEELTGKSPADIIPEEDLQSLRQAMSSAAQNPGIATTMPEIHIIRKDGTSFPVEGVLTCLYEQAGVRGVVFNGRDITERKRAESERLAMEDHMRQVQKFDSLNLMAGSIAHTFNNFLTGVLGNLELALAQLQDQSPLKGYIEKADRAAKRVAELSSLMLTYVGQAKGDINTVDMVEIISHLKGMLEAAVPKNASLQFQLPNSPQLFKGNTVQIRQVIMNLVSNAAEAIITKGNTIILKTGTIYCDSSHFRQPFLPQPLPEGNYIFFEVIDNGCGMDRETASKAFDPFFTTRFKGRGMGLAAVLGIVRAHQGTVSLDSLPGQGTTARVLFPAVQSAAEPIVEIPPEPQEWHGSGTILLADDEEMVQDVGRDMLEALGYTVITAADGIEAVSIFKQNYDQIVCVILDMIMPKMGGDEAFREIRKIRPDVPVLLCSGYTEEQVAKRFVDTLPTPFMGKPFKLSVLAAKLQEMLK